MIKMSNRRRQQVRVIPQFEITKKPDYSYIFATGIFGGIDPNGARIIFYLDRLDPEMKRDQPGRMQTRQVNRELQVEVNMSPVGYKSMMLWMQNNVQQYEERFGEIISRPRETQEEPDLRHIS